ncbi:MAG: hypothetical protein GAK35_02171 [Herbaspirillum frisingense]|uniref:Uncharacterized protein n=1 Tax=Herbaspirillum frisingense TaxID=92645 RepID=A0A7V8JU23_9BURK|nr:MAG: hypothetical protein GAK35_02171 [Herbaspirillum frisingense]
MRGTHVVQVAIRHVHRLRRGHADAQLAGDLGHRADRLLARRQHAVQRIARAHAFQHRIEAALRHRRDAGPGRDERLGDDIVPCHAPVGAAGTHRRHHRRIAAGIDARRGPVVAGRGGDLLHLPVHRADHADPAEACVACGQRIEGGAVVEVAGIVAAPVQRHAEAGGRMRIVQRGQQHRLDAGIAGAGGKQHQLGMFARLPGAGSEAAFQAEAVACLQAIQHAFGEQPAGHAPDVEFQPAIVGRGQIGDREAAAAAIVEVKLQILARTHLGRLPGRRLHDQTRDAGDERALLQHARFEAQGLRLQRPAGNLDAHVAAGAALAQQHFVLGQRIGRTQRHIVVAAMAACQHAHLAAAAFAAAAGEWHRRALRQRGVQQQVVAGFETLAGIAQFDDVIVLHLVLRLRENHPVNGVIVRLE